MNRDPKQTPHAGDILTKSTAKRKLVREVVKVDEGYVTYNSGSKTFTCWISTWQEWCRDATVAKASEV